MIVAVNVKKSLLAGAPIQVATERAWALTLKNCSACDYAIAVENGIVVGYFNLVRAFLDHIDPRRVAFTLTPCTPAQIAYIDGRIGGLSLKGIQKGKYIP